MRKIIILMTMSLLVLLSACSSETESLDSLGIGDYSAKELLVALDNETLVPENYAVSVFPDQVKVLTEAKEFSLPMDDEFYLSVAPYIDQTHECFYHSATGCRGELQQEDFHILFVSSTGEVLIDQVMNSGSNGFVDLWLPRGIEGTLTIQYDAMSVSNEITTIGDAKTCETTMRLQ